VPVRAIKTSIISILAVGLLAGSAVGVAAQDEEFPPLVYFTGSADEPGRFVEPEVTEGDLGWTMSGLEVHDIPFEMSDPRISGSLSGFGQGAGGGPFGEEGFVNFDAYTYRIDNEGGSWEGQGTYFWVAEGEDDEKVDMSTMLLTGSGDYEGLYAYVFTDWLNEPNIRGIITSLEPAAFPEPVPAPAE
jgi:hypothetical protein